MQRSQFGDARGQFASRQAPQVPFNGWPEVAANIWNAHDFVREPNATGLSISFDLEPDRIAPKKDFCAQRPKGGPDRLCRLAQKLPFEPDSVPLREPLGFCIRPAARYGDARRAVRAKPQHITSRAPMADETQPDSARADSHRRLRGRAAPALPKWQFKLHEGRKAKA